jgi:hypothetical protein
MHELNLKSSRILRGENNYLGISVFAHRKHFSSPSEHELTDVNLSKLVIYPMNSAYFFDL